MTPVEALRPPAFQRVPLTLGRSPIWVKLAAGALVVALAVATLWRHSNFLSHTFDLGFYVQDAWVIANGVWRNTVYGFHVFADHLSPILIPLAGAAWLSAPETLLVVQALAIGLGILPAYRLGSALGGSDTARLMVAWYGLSAAVWYATLFDFHPVVLGVPLLLWLMQALETGPLGIRAAAIALLLASVREDMALLAGVVLLQAAWRHRSTKTAIAGAAVIAAAVAYVVWASRWAEGLGYQVWYRYADFGGEAGSWAGFVQQALSGTIRLIRPQTLVAFGAILIPMLVVPPLAGWRRSWPGMVMLILNGLSAYGPQADLTYHYYAPAIPFLLWGAAASWPRFRRRRANPTRLALAATALTFLALGPIVHQGFGLPDRFLATIVSSSERRAMQHAVDRIPADVAVSASDHILPHLAERAEVFPFPGPMLCSQDPIFYIATTRYVPTVVVESADLPEGPDWPSVLAAWGYRRAYAGGGAEIWHLSGPPGPSVQCPSASDRREEILEQYGGRP